MEYVIKIIPVLIETTNPAAPPHMPCAAIATANNDKEKNA